MEKEIKVLPEQNEQLIALIKEPFMLTKTQNKTVPLDMAEGDQRIIPDAGYLLQSVVVEMPETFVEENIRDGVNIGGKIGNYAGIVLDPLDNPATPTNVFSGFEYYDDQGNKHEGSFIYPPLDPAAAESDVVSGKKFIKDDGSVGTGSLDPDTWTADFLVLHHIFVTVGANNVTTTLGVKDYLLAQSGVDGNRLFAFCLREKPSYQVGEIGRCVLYPNSSIGYFSASQYTASGWGTGRMLSGYSAVLPAGSVYDIYYWSV